MTKKIYIGKLPATISEQQITDIFLKIGEVLSVKLVKSVNFEKNSNYGYVQMSNDTNTKKAIHDLNNTMVGDSRIKVIEAHFLDQERKERSQWTKKRSYK